MNAKGISRIADESAVSREPMYGVAGWARKHSRRLFISDFAVVVTSLVGAHAARFGGDPFVNVAGPAAPPYVMVTVAIGTLWLAELEWTHSRDPRIYGHGAEEYARVVRAAWRTFAIVAVVGFLTHWEISRGYLLMALPVGTLVLLAYRHLWRLRIHHQRDAGFLNAQVIVVGGARTAAEVVRRLRRATHSGYHVVGVCLPQSDAVGAQAHFEGVPVLGPISDGLALAQEVGADFIVLAGNNALSHAEVKKLGWSLEGTHIGLIVAPTMVDVAGPRVRVTPIEGLSLLFVDTPTFGGPKYLVKSAFDRLTALVLLVITAIPMLIVALIVKTTSPGPVHFVQTRVGLNGRSFRMLKFRSMVAGAEDHLAQVTGDGEPGVYIKPKDDPRITRVGRFLRRYSIDELPQLLNVVRGDMSIVGPRPQIAMEVAQYDAVASRRLLVKPGMTGLWQVSGRSLLSPDDSMHLDAYYTENWSVIGDVMIVLRTVAVVLRGRGAR